MFSILFINKNLVMISPEHLKKLSELLIKYLEVRSELVMLQVKDYITQIITNIILLLISISFVMLMVLLGCFALAFYLNEVLESPYLGFVITIALFSLLFISMYLVKKKLIKAVVFKTISDCFDTDLNINNKEND